VVRRLATRECLLSAVSGVLLVQRHHERRAARQQTHLPFQQRGFSRVSGNQAPCKSMGFQSGFNQAPCKSTGVSVGFLVTRLLASPWGFSRVSTRLPASPQGFQSGFLSAAAGAASNRRASSPRRARATDSPAAPHTPAPAYHLIKAVSVGGSRESERQVKCKPHVPPPSLKGMGLTHTPDRA
jgi:hypothetical protein